MEKRNLIKGLARKIRSIKKANKKQVAFPETNQGFVLNSPETANLNPKYVSAEEYKQIEAFYNFLMENPDFNEEKIDELMKVKTCEISYIKEVIKKVPNCVERLKVHGPRSIAIEIVSQKMYGRYTLEK